MNEDLESLEIPTELLVADPHTNAELQGNLLQDMSINSNNFLKIRNCPNCAATPVWRFFEKGQFFMTLDEEEGPDEMKNLCREE